MRVDDSLVFLYKVMQVAILHQVLEPASHITGIIVQGLAWLLLYQKTTQVTDCATVAFHSVVCVSTGTTDKATIRPRCELRGSLNFLHFVISIFDT